MGWYLRKSFRMGPLRLNLSKSGLGISAGVAGFRVGTGPRGSYVHAGRGGLYFRQRLGGPSDRRQPNRPPVTSPEDDPGQAWRADTAEAAVPHSPVHTGRIAGATSKGVFAGDFSADD